jgi:hypothetical protein
MTATFETKYLVQSAGSFMMINMTNQFDSPRHFYLSKFTYILNQILDPENAKEIYGEPANAIVFFSKHSNFFKNSLVQIMEYGLKDFVVCSFLK